MWSAGQARRSAIKGEVEQMFMGQYQHNLDTKGRLIVPSRFRELLMEGAYIVMGFDRNLMVLTASTFDTLSQRINMMNIADPMARLLKRLLYSNGDRVELDKAGRILIPEFLRQSAGLSDGAIVVGAGNYFEIWSPEQWNGQVEQLQDTEANAQRFMALDLASG